MKSQQSQNTRLRNLVKKVNNSYYSVIAFTLLVAMCFSILPFSTTQVSAVGTISGTVYIDYNMNGTMDITGAAPNYSVDTGASGVTVTAYDSSGTQRGTAVSGVTGAYTLNATGTGPYRLEFTTLPSGFNPSAVGTNNASTVRFVNDGSSSNNDFGIVRDLIYSENDPLLATSCYVNGNPLGGGTAGSGDALAAYPYSSSGETAPVKYLADASQIGATWGLAWQPNRKRLFTAAVVKRHVGLGPQGIGGIYVTDFAANGTFSSSSFLNLSSTSVNVGTIATNAARGLTAVAADPNHDVQAFATTGKIGIGDIDISEDGDTLWGVNLATRKIFSVDVSGASAGTVTEHTLTGEPACTNGVFRPWALEFKNGIGYLGGVCTAESSGGTRSNLRGYVLSFDPSAPTAYTTVFNAALDFDRGQAYIDITNGPTAVPANTEQWYPWLDVYSDAAYNKAAIAGRYSRPTPILADMEIDQNGAMSLSFIDRAANQLGYINYKPDLSNTTDFIAEFSSGDLVKACPNGSGGWNIESNGSCATQTGSGVGNGEGNGNGEFYALDRYANSVGSHEEVATGGSAHMPGSNELVNISFDPTVDVSAAGHIVHNSTNGSRIRGYQLFNNGINSGAGANGLFGKANGLGDTELMKSSAPLQIGNRVWTDTNNNGVQDPGEAGIQNVALQLWADTNGDGSVDTQVGSVTTDANGNYVFGGVDKSNLFPRPACVLTKGVATKVLADNDDATELPTASSQVSLNGFGTTGLWLGGLQNGPSVLPAIIGTRFTDLNIPQGSTITASQIKFVSAGGGTVNPLNITIQGEATDNPLPFAAVNSNISGRSMTTAAVPWAVPNWGGGGESGPAENTPDISSIVQELVNRPGWSSGNSMVFKMVREASSDPNSLRIAIDYSLNPGLATALEITYTEPCSYEVEPNTKYEVRIPSSNFSGPLSGLSPSSSNADTSANGDLRDSDGTVSTGMDVYAPVMTGENGKNDHTYDFGFSSATTYSVGNRLWFDTNDDGIIDGSEVGKAGASVSIFLDAGGDGIPDTPGSPINTLTTDGNGYYRFDGLPAGNYVIRVNPSNFSPGGMLEAYANTTGINTADVESMGAGSNAENGVNPTDADDVLTDGILSNTIALGPGEPSSEADVPSSGSFPGQGTFDTQSNVTIDLGFYKLTLSGTVWNDNGNGTPSNNNDGELDATELMLTGYTVLLYDSAGNEIPVGPDGILGTADDGPGGMLTDSNGDYNFMGMPAGDYRVVLMPSGATSSNGAGEEADPDTNGDDNDNGFPDNTGNFANAIISGIVTLTPGDTSKTNNTVNNAMALTSDPTVDFGLILSPTAVKLDQFNAHFDGGKVVVEWSTGDESRNIGFNVYRETNGQKELLTNAPVAGSALKTTVDMQVKGNTYRWIDKQSKRGGVYYLEDLDIEGTRTMHGPIQPNVKFGYSNYDQTSSRLLSDMVEMDDSSAQKDFVGEVSDVDSTKENLSRKDSSDNSDKQREIAAMKGVKLFVKESGWYQVSLKQLAQTGFDTNSNKDSWQLFANGNEIPMQLGSDTVEFYGRGLDTQITDEKVYYLVAGKQAGLRLPVVKGTEGDGKSATSYKTTAQRKDRSLYLSSLLNGDMENWFGAVVFTSSATSLTLAARNPFDDGAGQAIVKVKLQGLTGVQHLTNVEFNGTQLGVVENYGKENREFEFTVPMSAVLEGDNQITLQSVGAGNDISTVDTVSLQYERKYIANDGHLSFSVAANQAVEVGGFENEAIRVYEIGSNNTAVNEIDISAYKFDGTAGFALSEANHDREFLAVDESIFTRRVARLEANYPSNWHARKNQAEFIIIAPNSLDEEAEALAARREAQGWKTAVVNVEDIYDEYSFGARSNEAIKTFLNDASSIWELPANYVLLFGDSSIDQRNYLNQIDRDLIPTKLIDTEFMETTSDSWLADFNNDGIEDISLGRLPLGDTAEARLMLAKLQRFDQQETRETKTSMLVADNYFEGYNDSLEARLPEGVGATRINRSQMSDSQMRSEIISKIQENPLVVTYTGHGSTGIWANSNVLRVADVAEFSNDKLSFFMLMTCLNGYSSSAYSDSLAEVLVKAENGAVAVWASSGSTYATGQILMSRSATDGLFGSAGNASTIGDITRNAKQTTEDMDARRTWQLIGDPTIVIK